VPATFVLVEVDFIKFALSNLGFVDIYEMRAILFFVTQPKELRQAHIRQHNSSLEITALL
jgi:hypothetical protein